MIGLLAIALGACATTTPPVTKLVGGRQITTRSVDPDAYEHVSRALLYEDHEHWQEAAAELHRAILLDEESPELHAHLAELLVRQGDVKEATAEVHASLKIARTAPGLIAEAHVRQIQGDPAGVVAALRQATAEVEFQAEDDEADTCVHCGGRMKLRALVRDHVSIERFLRHQGLWTSPSASPRPGRRPTSAASPASSRPA
jgi:Tfp pilus assembly protein PilF